MGEVRMKRVLSLGLLCLLSIGAQAFTAAAPAKEPSSLKQGFQAPPSDVRPGVFYQVMGGSITTAL